ncbi:hypothetical protein B0A55_01207 [Friedmanniomyces simplex]|uniref:Deacetylase complex subunit Sds3 n=1 Tax=Friedmanniomyces simplex TaxID=329884 RepID=A0A4U0Y358_9PEZI|nr:hypothetical protein B0A55_01207 [Friedmanniomyces simplex]
MAVTHRHVSLEPSASPPLLQQQHQQPQNLTKRDVRRNRIMERLQGMVDSFASNQQSHYRAQLQAVQVDMTLVLRADPYDGGSLEDGGEEVREMVEGLLGAGAAAGDEASRRDYVAMAGKRYAEFAREVNDELEKRDTELAALHNNYHSSVAELERLTQQKLHQAEEEHKALTNTIRLRLQASLTKKRQHLLRDKEQLDIADSNALLLHPNHFSINNPGSPGGGQNRKTRHLRHRAGSPSAGEVGGDNGKRKRKAGLMNEDDGNESPVPGFRPLPPPDALGGGRSPFKDAREKSTYTQFEAPAYSLERIFTDKELAMASATAQQATHRYFHQSQQERQQALAQAQAQQQQQEHLSTTVPSVDGETLPDAPPGPGTGTGPDGENETAHPTTETAPNGSPPPASAPEMDRHPSTTSHHHQPLTRGHARANPLAALSDLAAAASSLASFHNHHNGAAAAATAGGARENPFAPVVPAYHAISRAEKSGAPAPPGVGVGDVDGDLALMRRIGGGGALHPETGSGNGSGSAGLGVGGGGGLENGNGEREEVGGNSAGLPLLATEDAATASTAKDFRARLLDQALGNSVMVPPYRVPVLEAGPAMVGGGRVERPSWTGFAQVPHIGSNASGGVSGGNGGGSGSAYEQQVRMRQEGAQTGFGGVGVTGSGVGSSMAAALGGRLVGGGGVGGGEAMSRTTSAGGGSEVGEAGGYGGLGVGLGGGRRGRGRVV